MILMVVGNGNADRGKPLQIRPDRAQMGGNQRPRVDYQGCRARDDYVGVGALAGERAWIGSNDASDIHQAIVAEPFTRYLRPGYNNAGRQPRSELNTAISSALRILSTETEPSATSPCEISFER